MTRWGRATRHALAEVHRRVAHDDLPLLSLLQAEPLQLQSSHPSFAEYLVCTLRRVRSAKRAQRSRARRRGSGPRLLVGQRMLAIGAEMGDPFREGLLRAAGVDSDSLDLAQKLGGDRPTVLRVIVEFTAVLTSIDVGCYNKIGKEHRASSQLSGHLQREGPDEEHRSRLL